MRNKINISIPKPCHENWEGMTAVDKGKFCASCQKKVHDFTNASDREIVIAFKQNQNLCGRFLTTQLHRDLVMPEKKSSAWLATTAAIVSLIGIGTQESFAQGKPLAIQTDKKVLGDTLAVAKEEIEVTGSVSDEIGPLPGANVFIKGSDFKVFCDINGNFTIKAKKNDILVTTYVGYNDSETKILNGDYLKITLKENSNTIERVEMLGGIFVKKRTFFGRIFHSIGNWFRK